MSNRSDLLSRTKPLADPLRGFSRLLVALAILLPLTNWKLFSAALSAGCALIAVAILVSPSGKPNAIYLRAFRSDESTARLRLKLASILGPKFRLSGIRPPREKTSTFVRFLLPYLFALRYAGSKSMELEADDDWMARLWKTYQNTRLVFIDVRDLTSYVHQEIQMTLETIGIERCIFLTEPSRSDEDWRQTIAAIIGPGIDVDRALLLDVTGPEMESRLKAMVQTLPAGVAGQSERGRQYVLEHVSEEELKKSQRLSLKKAIAATLAGILLLSSPIFWAPLVVILQPLFLASWGAIAVMLAILAVPIARMLARAVRLAQAGFWFSAVRGVLGLGIVVLLLACAVALGPQPGQTLLPSGLNEINGDSADAGPDFLHRAMDRAGDMMGKLLDAIRGPDPQEIALDIQRGESTSLSNLKQIGYAESGYKVEHPNEGFSCSIDTLSIGMDANPVAVDLRTLGGHEYGYKYGFASCTKVSSKNGETVTNYKFTATPEKVGVTGKNGFCLDGSGNITRDPAGGVNCTEVVDAVK